MSHINGVTPFISHSSFMKNSSLRLVLEILMGLCLITTSVMAYVLYTSNQILGAQINGLSIELVEVHELLDKRLVERPNEEVKVVEVVDTSKEQLEALKSAFSNGVIYQDLEKSYKTQKYLSADQQVGLATVRLLTKGSSDQGALDAIQKALETAEFNLKIKEISASGKESKPKK